MLSHRIEHRQFHFCREPHEVSPGLGALLNPHDDCTAGRADRATEQGRTCGDESDSGDIFQGHVTHSYVFFASRPDHQDFPQALHSAPALCFADVTCLRRCLVWSELTRQIQTPAFWIGTVIVGFFINIASHYLLKWMDRQILVFGAWRASWPTKRYNAKVTKRITAWLDLQENAPVLALLHVVQLRIVAFIMLVLAFTSVSAVLTLSPESKFSTWSVFILFSFLFLIFSAVCLWASGLIAGAVEKHRNGTAGLMKAMGN